MIGLTSKTTRLNDDAVQVSVRLSAPAYCYLIAFNPNGKEQLCYPESADRDEAKAKTISPMMSTAIVFPQGKDYYFTLNDAVGVQAFVLAASTKPLPPYSKWRSQFGTIPWDRFENDGVWQSDGRGFKELPDERGTVQQRGARNPLTALLDFFMGCPEFETVRIMAFPVTVK